MIICQDHIREIATFWHLRSILNSRYGHLQIHWRSSESYPIAKCCSQPASVGQASSFHLESWDFALISAISVRWFFALHHPSTCFFLPRINILKITQLGQVRKISAKKSSETPQKKGPRTTAENGRLCLAIFVWLISVGANSLTNNAAWLKKVSWKTPPWGYMDGNLFWGKKFTYLWLGWWFQTFFIFSPTWGDHPIWLIIFFRWVETTN